MIISPSPGRTIRQKLDACDWFTFVELDHETNVFFTSSGSYLDSVLADFLKELGFKRIFDEHDILMNKLLGGAVFVLGKPADYLRHEKNEQHVLETATVFILAEPIHRKIAEAIRTARVAAAAERNNDAKEINTILAIAHLLHDHEQKPPRKSRRKS